MSLGNRTIRRTATVVVAVLLGACGSESGNPVVGSPVETEPAPISTTEAPTVPTSTTSVTSSTSTTVAGTTTASIAPSLETGSVELPSGSVVAGAGDLFILHSDGDLWLHPGILDGGGGAPLRLADLEDPRIPVVEGPGPNTVDDVAGIVNGAVYYSDCCEPVSGNVFAATGEDSARVALAPGYAPTLSPDRTRLATMNNYELIVIDLTSGSYVGRMLNEGDPIINPWDLIWTPDGASLIMLYFDDAGFQLSSFDTVPPFIEHEPVSLGITFDASTSSYVQFAGRGPGGELAVAVRQGDTTLIRYFDAATLAEIPNLQRALPAQATSVRLAADGVSLLWVDSDSLWFQPVDGEARQLGSDYTAAWFTS